MVLLSILIMAFAHKILINLPAAISCWHSFFTAYDPFYEKRSTELLYNCLIDAGSIVVRGNNILKVMH